MRYLLLLVTALVLLSCSDNEAQKTIPFFKHEPQIAEERHFVDTLCHTRKIHMYDTFGILNPADIRYVDGLLYVSDRSSLSIFVVDITTLEVEEIITFDEGRGPGELEHLSNFSVSDNFIFIRSSDRLNRYTLDGSFDAVIETDRVYPHRALPLNDERIIFLSPRSLIDGYVLHIINPEGGIETSFGEVYDEDYNFMKYSGAITTHENHIYYAGFSEHIFKKWTTDGELIYSRSTAEKYPFDMNMITFLSDDQRMIQYNFQGYYSAIGLQVSDDLIFLQRLGQNMERSPIASDEIDLYLTQTGDYLHSIRLEHLANRFIINQQNLITLFNDDGEVYVVTYDFSEPGSC